MPKKPTPRAGAVEGVSWYFSEDRPTGPTAKPYFLTYDGGGVEEVKGVGLFQNGTTAEVGEGTAEAYRGRPGWIVRKR